MNLKHSLPRYLSTSEKFQLSGSKPDDGRWSFKEGFNRKSDYKRQKNIMQRDGRNKEILEAMKPCNCFHFLPSACKFLLKVCAIHSVEQIV